MTRKMIGRMLVAISLALAGAEAARAVDYTLLVPVEVKQLTPEIKISITCQLLLKGFPSKLQTQTVALANGATSEAPQPTTQSAPIAPRTGATKAAQLISPNNSRDGASRAVAALPPQMKFVFALSDDEAKAVYNYGCMVVDGANLVKNGKALSTSVMQVGGCVSAKCREDAGNPGASKPTGGGGQ